MIKSNNEFKSEEIENDIRYNPMDYEPLKECERRHRIYNNSRSIDEKLQDLYYGHGWDEDMEDE